MTEHEQHGGQILADQFQSTFITVNIEEKMAQNRDASDSEHFLRSNGGHFNKKTEDENLKRDDSFVSLVQKEAIKIEQSMNSSSVSQAPPKKLHRKKVRKSIFISYSPDAGFVERKFIVESVRQLKENNLSEDIWFDKDEENTDCPCWFSFRLEAVERCRAAILFLSHSYFSCPVTMYEGTALLERYKQDTDTIPVFLILFSLEEETEIPKHFQRLGTRVVDLTRSQNKSIAERASMVVGSLMMELEKIACIGSPPLPISAPDGEFSGEYKRKKISQWTANDLQEWLFNLGIKEFFRQSLAENMVDGFLLMSMTDQDMINHIGIDNRVVRKKIMQQILQTLDKEHKLPETWHLRARSQKARANCVYLVYDPTDVRLAKNLKLDLTRKGLQVRNPV